VWVCLAVWTVVRRESWHCIGYCGSGDDQKKHVVVTVCVCARASQDEMATFLRIISSVLVSLHMLPRMPSARVLRHVAASAFLEADEDECVRRLVLLVLVCACGKPVSCSVLFLDSHAALAQHACNANVLDGW